MIHRNNLFEWLTLHEHTVALVIHLGARTDTREMDEQVFDLLNVSYSKAVWDICAEFRIPLIYASSAATYGMGEIGFSDDHGRINSLHPLNPYGHSKHVFDQWVLRQESAPPFWAGLKFFNVYGEGEHHKNGMASMVFHCFNQITDTGVVRLFKSHIHECDHGDQVRDFIYVRDVVEVILFMMKEQPASGIYNVGTSKVRSFNDLARAVFRSMSLTPKIEYIEMPATMQDKYQYYTQADITKLRSAGYKNIFTSLERGVDTYVKNFLNTQPCAQKENSLKETQLQH
jgi:ADP-L-glycero-D-manno-heptose 6-epimerase